MNARRESFYRCIFSSPRTQRVAHVRAWDPAEAVMLFRTELEADGVHERGRIEVSKLDGVFEQQAEYRP